MKFSHSNLSQYLSKIVGFLFYCKSYWELFRQLIREMVAVKLPYYISYCFFKFPDIVSRSTMLKIYIICKVI